MIILFYGQSEVGIYNSQAEECTSQQNYECIVSKNDNTQLTVFKRLHMFL